MPEIKSEATEIDCRLEWPPPTPDKGRELSLAGFPDELKKDSSYPVEFSAVQVSSMKTRRSGSRSSSPSNQSSRRFRISGRSCSLARCVTGSMSGSGNPTTGGHPLLGEARTEPAQQSDPERHRQSAYLIFRLEVDGLGQIGDGLIVEPLEAIDAAAVEVSVREIGPGA